MPDNPCIPVVARILGANDPPSTMATILFEHYETCTSNREKTAFVIAIIGEVLMARTRSAQPSATANMGITPEMIEAGIRELSLFDFFDPGEWVVHAVYVAMAKAACLGSVEVVHMSHGAANGSSAVHE
jgi:hypothetical protein